MDVTIGVESNLINLLHLGRNGQVRDATKALVNMIAKGWGT